MKEKILELLTECSDYVSGQDICNRLGVSRTAVWKNINILKEEGYQIDSVNNKGYKLLAEPDRIDAPRIQRYLHTRWLGNSICYEREMDSTNTQAKRLGENDAVNGTVVVTERQTAGRGRRGKTWVSPVGNCYISLLLRPEILINRASVITLVSAMALAKAIKQVTSLDTMIKWPNDVIANGKKLCGILTESSTDLEYINYVVVGIGINTNQTEFPEEIREMASSIRLETGAKTNRAELLGSFLNTFEQYYETFLKTEDLSELSEEYNRLLINRGKEVKIIEQEQERILRAVGIDQKGGLIVENERGVQETIISGEVSVRGLYGYV
ncbi:MAG: biotin--[Lachnospiraceae bacterium]|nr:biotin--[acetyl-CoA-carboxylase] ligase [Lachnospiraceae bacterium]